MPADAEFVEGLAAALASRGASIRLAPSPPIPNPFRLSFQHDGRTYRTLVHVRRLTPQRGIDTDHHRAADEWHAQMIFDGSVRGSGVRNLLERVRGYRSVLLGYVHLAGTFVVVGWDANRRAEYAYSRSLQIKESTLRRAAESGVAQQASRGGEIVVAFRGEFFPEYLSGTTALHAVVDGEETAEAEPDIPLDVLQPRERRAVLVTRAVRDIRFKNFFATNYRKCVVCGLDARMLLEAAHIVAVAEVAGNDHPSNGLQLCRNCHALFDAGALRIRPDYVIEIPDVDSLGASTAGLYRAFQGAHLQLPKMRRALLPDPAKLSLVYDRRR